MTQKTMKQDKMVTPKKKAKKVVKAPTKARILFILDRSGSMGVIKEETIGGFNAFIKAQQELPGAATLTLVQFDHEYKVVHDKVKLADVPELTTSTFVPRGMTALYDAVGRTIASFKDDNPKDTKTIVAILTDGQENSSKEYNYSSVRNLISQVEAEHGWETLFIGANMDAGAVATAMGIKLQNSVTFDYNKLGASNAMATVNFATSSLRGSAFTYADGSGSADCLDMTKLYADVKNNAIKTEAVNATLTTKNPAPDASQSAEPSPSKTFTISR